MSKMKVGAMLGGGIGFGLGTAVALLTLMTNNKPDHKSLTTFLAALEVLTTTATGSGIGAAIGSGVHLFSSNKININIKLHHINVLSSI